MSTSRIVLFISILFSHYTVFILMKIILYCYMNHKSELNNYTIQYLLQFLTIALALNYKLLFNSGIFTV